MQRLWVASFLLLGYICKVQGGGWANFLCPKDGKKDTPVGIDCLTDCVNHHGALGGKCGDHTKGDFNCYCDGRTSIFFRKDNSVHCTNRNHSADSNEACDVECRCNHGALGGTCDFDINACLCRGESFNPNNEGCPVKTPNELARYVERLWSRGKMTPSQVELLDSVKQWTEDIPNVKLHGSPKAGGMMNLLCPKNGDYRNTTTLARCDEDCKHNHGALTGQCGDYTQGNYNCYCEGRAPVAYKKSLHCAKPLEDKYRNACTIDCICNHAALGGYCDWNMKACFCQGQGKNTKNMHCPAKNIPEFAKYILDTLGADSIGKLGMKYVTPVIDGQLKL